MNEIPRNLRTGYALRTRPVQRRNPHIVSPVRARVARYDPLRGRKARESPTLPLRIMLPRGCAAPFNVVKEPDLESTESETELPLAPPPIVLDIPAAATFAVDESLDAPVASTTRSAGAILAPVISAPPPLPSDSTAQMMNAIMPHKVHESPLSALTSVVSSSASFRRAQQIVGHALGWIIDSPPTLANTEPPPPPQFHSVREYYLQTHIAPSAPCAMCESSSGGIITNVYFFCDGEVVSLCTACVQRSGGVHRHSSWEVLRQCYSTLNGIDTRHPIQFKWQPSAN